VDGKIAVVKTQIKGGKSSMTLQLKTVTAPNRQNVGWRESKAFLDTVEKLKKEWEFFGRGERARKNIVDTIDKFVEPLPRDEKKEARVVLCKKAGIVLRTFERWKPEGEQREEIGASIFEKAEEAGYDLTPSSIRSLADAKRLNPGATPAEIVKKAMAPSWDQEPKVKVEPLAAFVEALNEYLRKTDNDAIGVIQTVTNSPIREKICAVLKGICG
jgi:hypothetical protein